MQIKNFVLYLAPLFNSFGQNKSSPHKLIFHHFHLLSIEQITQNWLYDYVTDVARNVRRNLSAEVDQSGLLSTLSWIFNWRVPQIKHPHPMDVALNNYANYAKSKRRRQRLPKPSAVNKWSRRKRKRIPVTNRNSFQHRSSELSHSSPYPFEQPLDYFDASQVYFEPSQK